MRLRNGDEGYGVVTKTLHWLTVALLIAQFTIGYLMEVDDSGHGRGRGRGRGGESGHGRGRGGDDSIDFLDDSLVKIHVIIGITLLVVVIIRLLWRRTGLPPWAPRLSDRDRLAATWIERGLMACLVLMPATGLVLVLSGDDDLLGLHVASHIVFFALLALHLGLVLRRRLLPRMQILR